MSRRVSAVSHPRPFTNAHVQAARHASLLLVRVGLLLLSVGFVADLAYHGLPATFEPLLGGDGYRAHLLTFVGMLVMLVGVIRQGLAARSLVAPGGVSSHAHR